MKSNVSIALQSANEDGGVGSSSGFAMFSLLFSLVFSSASAAPTSVDTVATPQNAIGVMVGAPTGLRYQHWTPSKWTFEAAGGLQLLFPAGQLRAGRYVDTSSKASTFVRFSGVAGVASGLLWDLGDEHSLVVGPSAALHSQAMFLGKNRRSGLSVGATVGAMVPLAETGDLGEDFAKWFFLPELGLNVAVVF